jgi:hypothetical protein
MQSVVTSYVREKDLEAEVLDPEGISWAQLERRSP